MAIAQTYDDKKKKAVQSNAQEKTTEQQDTDIQQKSVAVTEAKSAAEAAPAVEKQYQYDASANDAYMQAIAALQNAQAQMPTYTGRYDAQIDDLYNQIVNREKFKYDLNADMLYQQYKDQYANLGRMAMKDSMGQAAALTGGYGSSYGQSVGQQQYNAYLQQLNNVVPELYGMAYDQYVNESDALYQQYAMLGDRADDEYSKYLSSLDQYWQNLSYLQGQADDAYNRGYDNWYNAYQMQVNAENTAYDRQLNSYNQLAELISSTGYVPSAEELTAAGMSKERADAYRSYYQQNSRRSAGDAGNPDAPKPVDDKGTVSNYHSVADAVYKLAARGFNIDDEDATIAKLKEIGFTEKQIDAYLRKIMAESNKATGVKKNGYLESVSVK